MTAQIDPRDVQPDVFVPFAKRLLAVTRNCRPNMHEPDEQDVSADVTGFIFDNAMGDNPFDNMQEITVLLRRPHEIYSPNEGMIANGIENQWFNLASLIALARLGAQDVLNAQPPEPNVVIAALWKARTKEDE